MFIMWMVFAVVFMISAAITLFCSPDFLYSTVYGKILCRTVILSGSGAVLLGIILALTGHVPA